ncbi:DUF3310 domain-containing protein [Allisonella histaminiformans]|uniref:DUF3310 domain-containing protein n=1 Tax=Allisonella histaminiformans TaxID=209880 RepID=UPI002943C0CA|nr:DUF3310 domain-containing protein [Allisonella histaminiformans]
MHVDLFATPHRFFIYIPDNDVLKVVTDDGSLEDIGCTGQDRYDADMDFVETLRYNDIEGFVGIRFRLNADCKLVDIYFNPIADLGEVPTKRIIERLGDKFLPEDDSLESPDYYQVTTEQPIQIMRELMSQDEFIGFLWGNIIKYSMRLKRKDNPVSEAKKIKQYATWLVNVYDGKELEGVGKEDNDWAKANY